MIRVLGIVLSVVFGATALLLVAGPVSAVDDDGRPFDCGSVVGAAAADPQPADCHEELVGRTELVAIAALACILTGSVVLLDRPQPAYGTSTCQSASI